MLRCHVFPVSRRDVCLPWNEDKITVLSVDPMEILKNRIGKAELYRYAGEYPDSIWKVLNSLFA